MFDAKVPPQKMRKSRFRSAACAVPRRNPRSPSMIASVASSGSGSCPSARWPGIGAPWIVAEHGRSANYVRNLEADPRVRVKIGRRWRSGTATVLPDDDPRVRLDRIGRRVNGFMVRAVGTDLLTIRVDLDPERAD